jgi:hypothetical protein
MLAKMLIVVTITILILVAYGRVVDRLVIKHRNGKPTI